MSTLLSRRHCLQTVCGALIAPFAGAASTPSSSEAAAIDALAVAFLKKHDAPGLSVAFARQGQMVYQAGFGAADASTGERVTTAHRFRIASVSKPLTSVAIYTLIEQGKLRLEDRVFSNVLGLNLTNAASRSVANITIHHLLTHTSGGWDNKGNDPMFKNLDLRQAELIAHTLQNRPIDHEPGTHYAYSNFGYCVLGRVIEKLIGTGYEDYVRNKVLAKCGVSDMQIGGNNRSDRLANEVAYFNASGPSAYGTMDLRRMDSHGGWIATATDLVKFLTHVDGFSSPPDILRASTIKTMTSPSSAFSGYSSGFMVNAAGNWWHLGSIPGTTAIAVRTASGMCWAGLINTRNGDIDLALDRLLWQMARTVPAWKA